MMLRTMMWRMMMRRFFQNQIVYRSLTLASLFLISLTMSAQFAAPQAEEGGVPAFHSAPPAKGAGIQRAQCPGARRQPPPAGTHACGTQ